MKYQPLVSIIIPVYNGSNFVKEAIESALAQTYENKEIIVVNDGSCDEGVTERMVLSYGEKVRYIYKENGGVSSALNLGIKSMKGEYFSWLSHDDLYLPQKIERQVEALSKINNREALVLCDFKCINKLGETITDKPRKKLAEGLRTWDEALAHMLKNGSFNGCAFLIPKKALDEVDPFDEQLRYCQDALMWMNIFLAEYEVVVVNEKLVCNRVHDKQLTQTGKELFHKDSEAISAIVIPKMVQKNTYAGKLIYSYAYHNAVLGNKMVVKNCINASKGKNAQNG